MFKIHDAVAPLAGSTPVRRAIVDEALSYLERLEREAGARTKRCVWNWRRPIGRLGAFSATRSGPTSAIATAP